MASKCSKDKSCNASSKVKQWVSRVVHFSSQYNSSSWGAKCVIGKPRVYPKYGDIHGAWAQHTLDSSQFIEIGFEQKIYIEEVHIYETYHAGGVRRIQAKTPEGKWHTIWQTEHLSDIEQSRIFSPSFEKVPFLCDELHIDVDCSCSGTWVELDAVQIVGTLYNFSFPPPESNLAEDLSKLVNNKDFSDIEFSVDGNIYYAHRAVLNVRSDFFRAMFSDYTRESKTKMPVHFPDICGRTFEVVLHYIYTNKTPRNCSSLSLVDVWRAADRFSMEGLQALAICEITAGLDVDNVVDVYKESTNRLPVIDDLKKACLDFMTANMSAVVRTKSFTSLPQEDVVELIQIMTSKLHI